MLKREIIPKVLMPELCILGMMVSLIILSPWVKLKYNSISRTGDIIGTRNGVEGK